MAITESPLEGVGVAPTKDPVRRETKLGPTLKACAIAFVCAVLVYAGTFLLQPRYLATESLYFIQSQESTSPLSPMSQDKGGGDVVGLGGALNSPLVGAKVQTAIGILDSRRCAAYISKTLGMASHYGVSEEKATDTVRQRLRADTDKDGFVKVDFDDGSKQIAVQALVAARKFLGIMSEELSLDLSSKNRGFVQDQLSQAKIVLEHRKNALSKVVGMSPAANTEALQRNYIDISKELDEADNQAAAASAQIASSERLYRKVFSNAMDFAGRVVAMSTIYRDLSTVTEGLQRRQVALIDAASRYQPTAPELKVAQLDQRNVDAIIGGLVNEQSKDLNEGVMPILGESKAKLAALRATISGYRSLLTRLGEQFNQAAKDTGNIETARRDFTSAELRVTTLENELMTSKIAEQRNPERFELVDAPYATGELAFPKRSMFAFVAFVVVLALQLVLRPTSRS